MHGINKIKTGPKFANSAIRPRTASSTSESHGINPGLPVMTHNPPSPHLKKAWHIKHLEHADVQL
jgi:hypothetical protein